MATTKEYKEFILDQLNEFDNITCKSMMGEYLLYYNDILFGGIYDDRLLVKIDSLEKAKNAPCVFNNWANFYKGKFISNTILNANAFEKLLK